MLNCNSLVQLRDFERAILQGRREILVGDLDGTGGKVDLGIALLLNGQYSEAIDFWRVSCGIRVCGHDFGTPFTFRGLTHWWQNDTEKAIDIWYSGLKANYQADYGLDIPWTLWYASVRKPLVYHPSKALEAVRAADLHPSVGRGVKWINRFVLGQCSYSEALDGISEGWEASRNFESLRSRYRSELCFFSGLHAIASGDADRFYEGMLRAAEVSGHFQISTLFVIAEWELRNGPAEWRERHIRWLKQKPAPEPAPECAEAPQDADLACAELLQRELRRKEERLRLNRGTLAIASDTLPDSAEHHVGGFLTLAGLVNSSPLAVRKALEKYARQNQGKFARASDEMPYSDGIVMTQGRAGRLSLLFPAWMTDVEPVAAWLSRELKSPLFLFHIHDGDLWMYTLFVAGTSVDQFNPIPDYWPPSSPEENLHHSTGDAVVVARFWPNLKTSAIKPYLKTWNLEIAEPGKACADDQYPYNDCRQLIDFMRRLGLAFPLDTTGKPVGDLFAIEFPEKEVTPT